MSKLLKKFTLLLLLIMLFSGAIQITATAETVSKKNSILPNRKLKVSLDELEKKYEGIEFVDISDTVNPNDLLEFSSMAEFEEFIKALKSNKSQNLSIEIPVDAQHTKSTNLFKSAMRSSGINDSDVISWYSPFNGWPLNEMFRWSHVTIDYTYDFKDGRPYFISYSNVTSNISGVNVCSWHQTGKAVNFTTKYSQNDKAEIEVNGYYLLGVSINGAPIGFTNNETWNCSLTLVPEN